MTVIHVDFGKKEPTTEPRAIEKPSSPVDPKDPRFVIEAGSTLDQQTEQLRGLLLDMYLAELDLTVREAFDEIIEYYETRDNSIKPHAISTAFYSRGIYIVPNDGSFDTDARAVLELSDYRQLLKVLPIFKPFKHLISEECLRLA